MTIYLMLTIAVAIQFGALAWLHYRHNQQEQMIMQLVQMQNMTGVQLMKMYGKTDDEIVADYNRFVENIHHHIN